MVRAMVIGGTPSLYQRLSRQCRAAMPPQQRLQRLLGEKFQPFHLSVQASVNHPVAFSLRQGCRVQVGPLHEKLYRGFTWVEVVPWAAAFARMERATRGPAFACFFFQIERRKACCPPAIEGLLRLFCVGHGNILPPVPSPRFGFPDQRGGSRRGWLTPFASRLTCAIRPCRQTLSGWSAQTASGVSHRPSCGEGGTEQ